MSFRITAVLLVALIALGSYAIFYEARKPDNSNIQAPWVYNIDLKDINAIKVTYQGKTVDIWWDDTKNSWFSNDPAIPEVDNDRVNGIRVLLSGPRSKRAVANNPKNLKDYGLDPPAIQARLRLISGQIWDLNIGNKSPDGQGVYVMFGGYDYLYLVDYTWRDELTRFVTDPPIKKPGTPTPVAGDAGY